MRELRWIVEAIQARRFPLLANCCTAHDDTQAQRPLQQCCKHDEREWRNDDGANSKAMAAAVDRSH